MEYRTAVHCCNPLPRYCRCRTLFFESKTIVNHVLAGESDKRKVGTKHPRMDRIRIAVAELALFLQH